MKSVWNEAQRGDLLTRVDRLSENAAPAWGRFTAPQMLAHLTQSFRMATGELPVASKRLFLRYPPFKQLVVYWMPFPRGAPTAPELLARAPGSWREEIAALRGALDALVARERTLPWPEHPAFGALTPAQWGVLCYRHSDHHLRQFRA